MRVVIMNDHAAALGAWLSVLAPPDPPATVLHIDRHSDLASPSQCDARATLRGDRATWARCADRAGFQLAAAWLGEFGPRPGAGHAGPIDIAHLSV